MENLLVITFEARHPVRNHHRRYEVAVGRDLFGHWTVTIRYGRIGQAGRERRLVTGTEDGVQAIIRTNLIRRLSAPRRIGCCYRIISNSSAPGRPSSNWLPADVMAQFESVELT